MEHIRPINFFIGPNNSGKSRLLRLLFEDDLTAMDSDQLPVWDIIDTWDSPDIDNKIDFSLKNSGYNHNLSTIIRSKFYNGGFEGEVTLGSLEQAAEDLVTSLLRERGKVIHKDSISKFIKTILTQQKRNVYEYLKKYSDKSFHKTYIPLLRGLRTLCADDVYLNRTMNDYFDSPIKKRNTGAGDSLSIFTGHTLYQDLTKALLGDHIQRKSVKDYEQFLSEHFFEHKEVALVPRLSSKSNSENDVVYLKLGNKPERPIYELGDGLQTIIMLTVQAFLNEEPTMFFIEEPEQNVHAGLQRALINAFRLRPQHMYFMTTHSNHFIDMAQEHEDISLQRVHQEINDENKEITVVESSAPNMAILQSLGVRASSVLTANCSIWVEGVTDKRYIRAYLQKYLQELEESGKQDEVVKLKLYRENLHYIFTEYQGSNITHWEFSDTPDDASKTPAKRLSQNILLIADADIQSKSDRVESLRKELGSNFLLLEWKEIENYIPEKILIETAKKRWETFNGKDGCQITRFSNLEGKNKFQSSKDGIGEILERYVEKNGSERKFYKAESGTIKDKVKFCNTAIELMTDEATNWKLTPQLRKLCEDIYKHIKRYN